MLLGRKQLVVPNLATTKPLATTACAPARDRAGEGVTRGGGDVRLRVYYLPNWDGVNSALVAATNQKEACHLLHSSMGNFRAYGGRRMADDHEYSRVALSEPARVWIRRIALTRAEEEPWHLRGG